MQQVYQYVESQQTPCTMEFLHGDDIAEEVIQYSKKIKADLVMIMTQEEMTWSDIMFISSSAQEIINGTDIPVISIKPKEKKDLTISAFEY